jgi:hypothetical protein
LDRAAIPVSHTVALERAWVAAAGDELLRRAEALLADEAPQPVLRAEAPGEALRQVAGAALPADEGPQPALEAGEALPQRAQEEALQAGEAPPQARVSPAQRPQALGPQAREAQRP